MKHEDGFLNFLSLILKIKKTNDQPASHNHTTVVHVAHPP
jgi:hypothetical protein